MRVFDVVALSADAQLLAAGRPEEWLGHVADSLPSSSRKRVIFLPPLFPNVAALPSWTAGWPIQRAVRASVASRPLRAAAARFAYPQMKPGRFGWVCMHDRAEAIYRTAIGEFAERVRATVVTTMLQGHPRQHWEDWPERSDLYHVAKAMGPDGQPRDMVRQRRPHVARLMRQLAVDPFDPPAPPYLKTDVGLIRVDWTESLLPSDSESEPVLSWVPRLTFQDERWSSWRRPSRLIRDAGRGCAASIQTALFGNVGAELVGETQIALRTGEAIVVSTPDMSSKDEPAWVMRTLTLG